MSVRVLKNQTMEEYGVITMEEAIEVVENAFKELGEEKAKNAPRNRLHVEEGGPKNSDDIWYWFNNIMGAVPGFDTLALRIDSSLREIADVNDSAAKGDLKMTYPGDFVGLVLLFDIHDCSLKAIMDDHYLSPLRVAATSGIGTDYMARSDATSVGMIGSGEQARAHLEAITQVRDIDFANVYSPTKSSRESFANEMNDKLDIDINSVSSPEDAVKGMDIINLATNAVEPVIDGSWLDPGMHVNSIVGGDQFYQRQECDEKTIKRADQITVNIFEQVMKDKQGDLYPRIQDGLIDESEIDELASLVTGSVSGRQNDDEITLMKNNSGMGIQFAAVGSRIYENIKDTNIGQELPLELFITKNEEGYAP